ncbi:hypothetical protein AN958_07082, partial [Leucoagaricus sp. SymC.cos]
ISCVQGFWLILVFNPAGAIIIRLLLSPFRAYDKHKSWTRVATDESFRFPSSSLRVNQMQSLMGTTPHCYQKWAKKSKRPVLMDDLGNDGSLMWFTDRRTSGKVVYYLHGGTYQLPMQDYAPPFWLSMLEELKKKTGQEFSFVALSYSLYPSASFPTQLLQAASGLSHLLSLGIKSEDIHLAGESAGGGLVLQLLSHLLHPYEGVPRVSLSEPLGGGFLMSPWVCLTTETASFVSNSNGDVLPESSWAYLTSDILQKLPEVGRPYVETLKAPSAWWDGINKIAKKITVYTGEAECLRDDDISFASTLKEHHKNTTLFVHKHGVHTDPYLTRLAGEKDSQEIVNLVVGHFQS